MTENFSPAVSVIVPMYNAEKYLPVCLESLRIQTFTDFEVIVVDDCSTDSSLTIAESFLEPFGGRLKIVTLEENTGSGAVPRNVGVDLSCGKYVCFIDNDDLFVDNALETFYNCAETFDADVVCMERFFMCDTQPVPTNLDPAMWNPPNIIKEPTLETDDLLGRVEAFLAFRYKWPPWQKFVRRSLLIDNDMKFSHMIISEDIIWTFELVCLAKNILHVPEPLYVYRTTETSLSRRKRSHEDELVFFTNPLIDGVDILNDFMSRLEFFNDKPTLRLQVMNFFLDINFAFMTDALKTLPTEDLYKIFLREFKAAGSSHAALISYLMAMNVLYRNELVK